MNNFKKILFYNTLTRKKEEFKPLHKFKAGFYACGLTVYDYAHIGNLRTYLFEDILRRVLEYNHYQVKHVQNFTDVGHLTSDADTGEDKIEKASRREKKSSWDIANYYIKTFKDDIKKLNIFAPHYWPKATENIKEQIELIKILQDKEFIYKIKDGIYFDSSKLKDYGQFANIKVGSLKAGARVKIGQKKYPTDFALWKFSYLHGRSFDPARDNLKDKRQMEWDSPWGVGFPGWHIECSAMSKKYLGKQFDIHAGGIDHIGVHHSNEIAQSKAAFGLNPARFWLHGDYLLVNNEKMSKSKGNFYTLRDIEKKGYNPLAFRYLILMTHYRQKMNFTWEALLAAQKGLAQIYGFLYNIFLEKRRYAPKNNPQLRRYLKKKKSQFNAFINNDLATPQALALMFEVMHDVNEMIWGKEGLSKSDIDQIEKLFLDYDQIFGLKFAKYLQKGKKEKIPEKIKKLVTQRMSMKQKNDFAAADRLRNRIEGLGYKVEDTLQGPVIKKIKII